MRIRSFFACLFITTAAAAQPGPPLDPDGPPWARMQYGPFLSTAIGIGDDLPPVHKGIVVRLRTRDGDWTDLYAVFDTDLLTWRCVWDGAVALRGIVYDGPHGTFPQIAGTPLFRFGAEPGLVFADADRARRPSDWGPIPTNVAQWTALMAGDDDPIFSYTIGTVSSRGGPLTIGERVWAEPHADGFAFVREIRVGGVGAADPVFRVIPPNAPLETTVTGGLRCAADGTLRMTERGSIRIAIAPAGTGRPALPAPLQRDMDAAVLSPRTRWGEPIVTRGRLDDPLADDDTTERIVRAAGAPAETMVLATAGRGTLELRRDDASVDSAPASESVVVRSDPVSDGAMHLNDAVGWWPSDAGAGTHERNAVTGADDLRLDGVTWRRGVRDRALDFDGTAAAWLDDTNLDLGAHDLTVAAWIHTTSDGTIFAVAPPGGDWAPDGATFFVRGGRLAFDVGWVGVVDGGPEVADGAWHHVAATWRHADGAVRLFVDGIRVAAGRLPLKAGAASRAAFAPRFGWTNANFPATTRFSGYMDGPLLLRRAADDDAIAGLAALTGEPLAEATIVSGPGADMLRIALDDDGRSALLELPPAETAATYDLRRAAGPRSTVLAWARSVASETAATARPFRIDRLTWPADNPHDAWMRFGAFTFLPGPDDATTAAALTTWSGDVWRVDGLDEDLDRLVWTRVATGLNQPFGIATTNDRVYVLGRDQITWLMDLNGDRETDIFKNLTNDARNSEHFHEPASGLLVAPDDSLYYVKAARHAKHALHDHHGTLLHVTSRGPLRGFKTEVVARGFRAPIGLCLLPDGNLLCSDQEGHWTPANRINLIRPSATAPRFYGNGWAAQPDPGPRIERDGERVQPAWNDDTPMEPPLCWLHPTVDRSPSAQVYVDHDAWGPLRGSILGLSYGTGEVYLVLRDDVAAADGEERAQGGIVKLGVQLPTGLLGGRIHPDSGDLYVCGLFGWSSDRTEPGGFFRVRPRPGAWSATLNVPHRMRARTDGIELTFLHPLDAAAVANPEHWTLSAWNYRRNANYGSKTYALDGRADARTPWTVTSATLSPDGRTVRLRIADFEPAMQVHVGWSIADSAGRPLAHEAHLTVHTLPAAE